MHKRWRGCCRRTLVHRNGLGSASWARECPQHAEYDRLAAKSQVRSVKRSTDPRSAEKIEDIVGLYADPPAHAVELSIDEKSLIQALEPTQPGLPMKPGRLGTHVVRWGGPTAPLATHDYKRHGTTTLFTGGCPRKLSIGLGIAYCWWHGGTSSLRSGLAQTG